MKNSAFDCIAVTSVAVFPLDRPAGRTVATASVVLNDQLFIRGISICEGENGLYVSYPQVVKNDTPRTVVFPVTRQLREHIENCVLEKFSIYRDGKIKKARDNGNYALYHTTCYNNGETLPDTEVLRIGDEEYCMELFNDIKAEHESDESGLFTNGDSYIDFEDDNGQRHIYAVKTSKS